MEVMFLSFCVTIVALAAISQNKDKITEKALRTVEKVFSNISGALKKPNGQDIT